jgi:hypothetical protein
LQREELKLIWADLVAEWEELLLALLSSPPASPLVVACWVLVTPMRSCLRYAAMEEVSHVSRY